MLNFDGHCDGDGDGVGTYKQAFKRLEEAFEALRVNLHRTKANGNNKVSTDIWQNRIRLVWINPEKNLHLSRAYSSVEPHFYGHSLQAVTSRLFGCF